MWINYNILKFIHLNIFLLISVIYAYIPFFLDGFSEWKYNPLCLFRIWSSIHVYKAFILQEFRNFMDASLTIESIEETLYTIQTDVKICKGELKLFKKMMVLWLFFFQVSYCMLTSKYSFFEAGSG